MPFTYLLAFRRNKLTSSEAGPYSMTVSSTMAIKMPLLAKVSFEIGVGELELKRMNVKYRINLTGNP